MKKCFKCGSILPIDDFYSHPGMADGRLNKCKACTRSDSEARRVEKMKDPDWAEREAERHRIKSEKSRSEGRACVLSPEKRREVHINHAKKYPQKHTARIALGNAVRSGKILKNACEICGDKDSEAHHDDYLKPLDVVWLCPKHHAARHVELRRIARRLALINPSAQSAESP